MVERYDELMAKRRRVGLTDEEANELGRLMAERAGRADEYGNAQSPPPDVRIVRATGTEREQLERIQAEEKDREGAQPEEDAGAGSTRDVDKAVVDRAQLSATEKDAPPPA